MTLKRSLSTMVKSLNNKTKTKTKLHKPKEDDSSSISTRSDEFSLQSSQISTASGSYMQSQSQTQSLDQDYSLLEVDETPVEIQDLLPPIPQDAPCNPEELTPDVIPSGNLTPQSSALHERLKSVDSSVLDLDEELESQIQLHRIGKPNLQLNLQMAQYAPRSGSVSSQSQPATGLTTPAHEDDLADAMAISILERVKGEKVPEGRMDGWAI
ncbi:unnamed protein product [Kuraishia capsulata CBS 1993]|uniref:Uncharacterized protein n=1 Tax=Kuraishia capsulata CBS 1993 TaxID=1382522 RepID=W6MP84_9ASCO|nr:uncharacterized protein KUCA_T00002877001 [Kuraishia capsulata CBS 1993]CDK26902.1 unnamed protein product [Kuraishia capsulata CBS 1993]